MRESKKVARGKEEMQARIKLQKMYKVCVLFKLKQNEKGFRKRVFCKTESHPTTAQCQCSSTSAFDKARGSCYPLYTVFMLS